MVAREEPSLRVAVAGLGAIGARVVRWLDEEAEGLCLVAVSARDRAAAARKLEALRCAVPVLPAAELSGQAEVVVECVPASAFAEVAEPTVAGGGRLVTVSCGQLLERMDLVQEAGRTGAQIIVPSGALLGLDAVRAAAEGGIASVNMITRKPPGSLAGAPYLAERGISLENLDGPRCIFRGTAREGARGFPANVNVAAALSLAGIGPDRTRLEVWADPGLARNTHEITVEAESARLQMRVENVPSEENPRTGKLTPLSVIAALKRLTAPLVVGT